MSLRPRWSTRPPLFLPPRPRWQPPASTKRKSSRFETPKDVPPVPEAVSFPTEGPKSAEVDIIEVASTHILEKLAFEEADHVRCVKIETPKSNGGMTVTPLWRILFAKGKKETDPSVARLEIDYYGDLTARDARIEGKGDALHRIGLSGPVFRNSRIQVTTGEDEASAIRSKHRFANGAQADDKSICDIDAIMKNDVIDGSFSCNKLKNDFNEWVSVSGSFECPVGESKLYPAAPETLVPSSLHDYFPFSLLELN